MDRAYDQDGAAERLEEIAFERIGNPHAKMHLSEIANQEDWTSKYEPMHIGTPKVWRLIQRDAQGSGPNPCNEEIVLTVQGIIAKKDIPPFKEKISINSAHAQFLRQSVTLVGLHTPTFVRAIENIAEIHALFGRSVGHQNLQECGIISMHQNEQAIELSNRYFTPKKYAGQAQEIAFSSDIDPHGYLQNAAGRNLIHIEDNVVQYFEQVRSGSSRSARFIRAKPITFQVGDIVEAQVSIILVPLRDHKFKSAMVLRGLTMFDGKFTQEAAKIRLQICQGPRMDNRSTMTTLKRNVGYMEEEIGATKHKLSKMRVDDDVQHAREDGWE